MWILLDRDGTIIRDLEYVGSPDDVQFLPGAIEGLKKLRDLGYRLAIISNQSGIGRGYFSEADVEATNRQVVDGIRASGVVLAGVYYCPHTPDDRCYCRKPLTGLIDQLAASHEFSPKDGWMIGDKRSDIEFGASAHLNTILISDSGHGLPDFGQNHTALDLLGAVDIIARAAATETPCQQ